MQSNIEVNRPDIMGCESICSIVGGGFPFPYIIDGYTSPIGTISKNPFIIIFTRTDIFLLKNYIFDYIFWLVIVYIVFSFFKKMKI